MDGFLVGRHRSAKKGASVEFADYRQYLPGDDIRSIDWKVYARKDRYYIRQTMAETNVRAMLCLDCSGSMAYRGELAARGASGKPLSKFDYARHLLAGFASVLGGQQDGFGFASFDDRVREYLPAKAGKGQLFRLLRALDESNCGGVTDAAAALDEIAERLPPRGMVVVASDFLGDLGPILKALQHVRWRRHELVVLHVLAEEELRFPFTSFTRFRDLEGAGDTELDPKAVRADYLDKVSAFVKALQDGCSGMRADYVPFSTAALWDKSLSGWFFRRATGAR